MNNAIQQLSFTGLTEGQYITPLLFRSNTVDLNVAKSFGFSHLVKLLASFLVLFFSFCHPVILLQIQNVFGLLFSFVRHLRAYLTFTCFVSLGYDPAIPQPVLYLHVFQNFKDLRLSFVVQVANMIRFLVDSYNKPVPAILEIPSKDHPYDPAHDSVLSRVKYLFNTESVASGRR